MCESNGSQQAHLGFTLFCSWSQKSQESSCWTKSFAQQRKTKICHLSTDKVHNEHSCHPLRNLRRSVAHPDKHTQQNVNDAKMVFEEETLSCFLQLVANQLEVADREFYGGLSSAGSS